MQLLRQWQDSHLAEEEVGDEVEDQRSRPQASKLSCAGKAPNADGVQNAHEGVAKRDCKSGELEEGHEKARVCQIELRHRATRGRDNRRCSTRVS